MKFLKNKYIIILINYIIWMLFIDKNSIKNYINLRKNQINIQKKIIKNIKNIKKKNFFYTKYSMIVLF